MIEFNLGDQATIAMVLYANVNHPNLRNEYPNWPDRIKQITKIWKTLPNERRSPYVTKARENRTANRINRPTVGYLTFNLYNFSYFFGCFFLFYVEKL